MRGNMTDGKIATHYTYKKPIFQVQTEADLLSLHWVKKLVQNSEDKAWYNEREEGSNFRRVLHDHNDEKQTIMALKL